MHIRYIYYPLILSGLILACKFQSVEKWQKVYGSKYFDKAECIRQTKDGSYILAGSAKDKDNILFSYVVKFDVHGKKICDWNGPKYSEAHAIDLTKDSCFIIAGEISVRKPHVLLSGRTVMSWTYESYVTKLNINLEKVWERSFGVMGESRANFITHTKDGEYIVASEVNRLRSDSNYGITKLDNKGNILWQKEYKKKGDDEAYCVQQTLDGGYIITGRGAGIIFVNYGCVYVVKIDRDGKIEWERSYHDGHTCCAYSILQTKEGGYILAGSIGSEWDKEPPNTNEAYIIKLDENGNKMWDKIYGGKGFNVASCITQTHDGDYIIAGQTDSYNGKGKDIYIIRIDAYGNLVWKKTYGGDKDDKANSILETQDGGYIVAGQTESYGAQISDIYLIKMDEHGNSADPPLKVVPLYDEIRLQVNANGNKTIVLEDCDSKPFGFSFIAKKKVLLTNETTASVNFDFLLDVPHGLAANNKSIAPYFKGSGGFIDMGVRPLDDVKKAPEEGYYPTLKLYQIIPGHTYCILASDGKHYAKIHVVNFDSQKGQIEFTWQYQPNDTNMF